MHKQFMRCIKSIMCSTFSLSKISIVSSLVLTLIKRWVSCGDMDRRLKIPHSAKAECGFRTTPEECLYDSGPIGPSV